MGGGSSKPKPRAAPPAITQIDRAVLDLKNARDRLQRYRNKLETDQDRLVEKAREAKLAGRKDKALGILRLKKYKQQEAVACENQLLNVLQMVNTIDSKQNESAVLNALAAGKDTLKKMHEETTVEDVLDLMDAIREEAQVEQEISDILAGVPELAPDDEEAALAELEALEAEMKAETTTPTSPVEIPALPTAPKTPLPEHKQPVPATATMSRPKRVAIPG